MLTGTHLTWTADKNLATECHAIQVILTAHFHNTAQAMYM